MKLRNKYGYLMFKLEGTNTVVLDKSAPPGTSYDQVRINEVIINFSVH